MKPLISLLKEFLKLHWCKVPSRFGTPTQINDGSQCSRFVCNYCPHAAKSRAQKPML